MALEPFVPASAAGLLVLLARITHGTDRSLRATTAAAPLVPTRGDMIAQLSTATAMANWIASQSIGVDGSPRHAPWSEIGITRRPESLRFRQLPYRGRSRTPLA